MKLFFFLVFFSENLPCGILWHVNLPQRSCGENIYHVDTFFFLRAQKPVWIHVVCHRFVNGWKETQLVMNLGNYLGNSESQTMAQPHLS